MATQRYIIEADEVLECMSSPRVRETLQAFQYEREINDGGIYPENRPLWGRLWTNAASLLEINPALAPLVEILDIEFKPKATPAGWDSID